MRALTKAMASVFMVPVVAATLVLGAALMLACWPFIPFLVYMKEKEGKQ